MKVLVVTDQVHGWCKTHTTKKFFQLRCGSFVADLSFSKATVADAKVIIESTVFSFQAHGVLFASTTVAAARILVCDCSHCVFSKHTYDQKVFSKLTYSKQKQNKLTNKQKIHYETHTAHIQQTTIKL